MPRISNKAYDQVLGLLKGLIDGIARKSTDDKLGSIVRAEHLAKLKGEIEGLRRMYLEKELETRLAYDQFESKFDFVTREVRNHIRITKGILGPNAEELRDFGIQPEKPRRRKLNVP